MGDRLVSPRARSVAIEAHGGQKYGERPYFHHLDAVAQLLAPYGDVAQAIGYLHDVLEDTAVSEEDLRAEFGDHIGLCVSLLTDQPGANRKERKAATYARLQRVAGPAEIALVVKTADRLANIRACLADQNVRLLHVYRSEHPDFRAAAYRQGLCEPLWLELDQLLTLEELDEPGHLHRLRLP